MPDSPIMSDRTRAKSANARSSGPECFMICDDEPLSQAQLQLFKDFEAVKLKHKKNTDEYYKIYYDPNKTYPQNVTLSSTGAPGPVVPAPAPPVVNGMNVAARQVSPVQAVKSAQPMPRIINVAGSQPARPSVPNGVPNRMFTSTPMISSVTSLNPQAQQQMNAVQMPVNSIANVQGAMPQMINVNGQQIRLLVTPQMQSQIQSGARIVFSSGGTTVRNMAPVMARANNTSGPRIMYTTTGQRVIQPPTPQAVQSQPAVTVQRQLQQQKQATTYQPRTVVQSQAAKRPATNTIISPAAKRQRPDFRDSQKENEHYGFKKGKKKYDDDTTSQPKFSCHHCNRRINSNIRFMQHIKNHLEKERQHTFSLNDMINCEHCYKRFRTPFERQCHIEKFHMKTDHVCGVCELSFENSKVLVQHLEEKHPSLQMPYICKICEYKTSIYDDIIVHYSKTHLGSKSLMCHFCLRILKTAKDFSRHCLKHLTISIRNGSHRCKSCKLMFLSYSELKEHADKDHVRFAKSKKDGIPPKNASKTMTIPSGNQPAAGATASTSTATASTTAGSTAGRTLTVRMPAFSKKSATPQAQFTEYEKLFRPYDLVKPSGPVWCCECGARVLDPKVHFKKHMQCTKCKFVTFCGETYANHMIVFHSARKPPTTHPINKVVRKNGRVVLTCKRCKFVTKVPSMMAWHVASACTGGISFMSFQRMIYPAKEKETDKAQEAEEIVILSDDEAEPVQTKSKAPVKKATTPASVDGASQASSDAGMSASNENSQDSSSAQSNASNNNSQLSFAGSLTNSSVPDEGSCIGSALAQLEGDSRMNGGIAAGKKTVQVNGR
ncbi:uncharacterized protein [Amphiura filiformis]|uniref:uncharacterized protein n=1 Tax=Amphiura filiformis TaxID=82378 RepID=UPI003B2109F9